MAQTLVATTATLLATGAENGGSKVKVAVPAGGQTVFLGTANTVTSGNGYGLTPGSTSGVTTDVELKPGQTLYGIVLVTPQTTHVLTL
jgi:hypothetical protein